MHSYRNYFLLKVICLATVIFCVMIFFASTAPKDFPVGMQVHIPKSISLSGVSAILAEKNIIKSPFLFKITVALLHGQGSVTAGDYLFLKPQNLWTVVRRIVTGDQQLASVKITIPEGSTVNDIAWILLKKMPDFNAPYFVQVAHTYEGYLFPDTYLFYPNKTPGEILTVLRATFDEKFAGLASEVKLSGRTAKDVVIMASLVEKEASDSGDRAKIAGILWKRLDEGMPLQVDASLVYITGDATVSLDDTKINSPYNTYKYKGLPKGPIANPGLDALKAVLHPVKTPYYYYLSDKKGITHYAVTHDGHVVNKNKYLR